MRHEITEAEEQNLTLQQQLVQTQQQNQAQQLQIAQLTKQIQQLLEQMQTRGQASSAIPIDDDLDMPGQL